VTERLKLAAVVLRTIDHGESDRVVTLLCQGRGRVGAFARGARASRKRFSGALEPFTLLHVELVGRPGSDLWRLESASVERSFHGIRGDLARIACAAYAVELARELTRDDAPHDDLLALLVDYLGRLDVAPAAPAMLRAFELAALSAAGFQPRLDACARCGQPVGAGAQAGGAAFSPADGGVLCATCARQATGTVALSLAGLQALRALQDGGLDAGRGGLDPAGSRESKQALARFLEHLLGRQLQARRFLEEIGHLLSE
jgi:DNA repair protein RecO (recombination protein O)